MDTQPQPHTAQRNSFSSFPTMVLKGLGQIMLQENALTGLLFLVGIFYGSWMMGAAALLATVCGTATALLLQYDRSEITKGLYGFSAALVGVGVMLFLKPIFLTWFLVIIGSAIASMLQHFFIQRKIPVFTLPFVLVTWAIIWAAKSFFNEILLPPSSALIAEVDYLSFGFKGFGQVIFQSSLVAGLLFFVGVFISSPLAALHGFAAGILSAMIAYQFSVPINDISMGLFGYNAVLCAIVFAGDQVKDGVWVLLSILLSLSIHMLMGKFEFIALTFPFVLASCVTLMVKGNRFTT